MNYAYNTQGGTSGFAGLNTSPWHSMLQNLNMFQQGLYNGNPDAAMQQFIDLSKPSNTQEDTLRRMLSSIQNQWTNSQIMNPQSSQSFADYLGGYDFNQAFARLGPSQRHENSNSFNRPVRTVTF